MPNRYTRSRSRRTTRRRRGAASSIQKAWRRKKRRKIGLVQRTLMANRQQIKRIKKSVETKMCDRVPGRNPPINDGTPYSGNYVYPAISVDNKGQIATTTDLFCPSLLQLPCTTLQFGTPPNTIEAQGNSWAREGQWVQMKSLTMKYKVEAGSIANERLTLMLVHDSMPNETEPDLTDLLTLAVTMDAGVVNPADFYRMAFQNLDNTGKEGRYKILWRKEHIVNPIEVQLEQVPAITQEAVGSVMRPAYYADQYANTLRPHEVYGSVTLKLPYKINYGTDGTNLSPYNQTIRLFAFTSEAGARPTFTYFCRFRFKDA